MDLWKSDALMIRPNERHRHDGEGRATGRREHHETSRASCDRRTENASISALNAASRQSVHRSVRPPSFFSDPVRRGIVPSFRSREPRPLPSDAICKTPSFEAPFHDAATEFFTFPTLLPAPARRWQSRNEASSNETAPTVPLRIPPICPTTIHAEVFNALFASPRSTRGRFSSADAATTACAGQKASPFDAAPGARHCRNPRRHVQNPGAKNMTLDAMPWPTHWSLQPPWLWTKLLGRLLVRSAPRQRKRM
jgi:hypothetical protein